MSQTMLLTKRLTAFLSQSASQQLHTLLLLSPTGKLLASASSSPASVLRTQATLAVALWSSYNPLPINPGANSSQTTITNANARATNASPSTITIQLEHGIMCIRALTSGLLFVAIGQGAHLSGSQYVGSPAISAAGSPRDALQYNDSQANLKAGSEAGSVGSERGQGGIWSIRKRVEEVGNLLEGKLGGFELSTEAR